MAKLSELATIVRSKNAGPFRLTFDVLMPDLPSYKRVRDARVLERENVARTLGVPVNQVSSTFAVEAGLAFKVTLLRPQAQNSFGESDTYGCQQHVPLMGIEVP
ncbi:MAG: DUF4387 domain-containing protein [Alphaproteobacteria bacterium]|nr:DUF4387 domain-containing protein [Alphaproteobacteria bacterium]